MSHARRRGFTLIELMVVIVILGTLVALVGPNVWGMLFKGTHKAVEFQITNFRNAIDAYYLDKRGLPSGLEDLAAIDPTTGEPWLRTIPRDPWGEAYEYRVVNTTTREYAISSAGDDKQPGTADDVAWSSVSGFKGR